jgi:HK97 family phage major capsid protein
MHRTFFWNTVVPLMIAAGGTTVKQIEDAPSLKFLSYPVRISQSLPRADANSQIPALLGDIKLSSTFGDRMGHQIKQADQNDDDWDNDLMAMKSTTRWDVNHHDVGDTVEAGPVVGIISAAS